MGIPIIRTTHQSGHIRAAQIGNERLLASDRFNALHLSGGTTDLLTVFQEDGCITGIDLLADGGVIAAIRTGQYRLQG